MKGFGSTFSVTKTLNIGCRSHKFSFRPFIQFLEGSGDTIPQSSSFGSVGEETLGFSDQCEIGSSPLRRKFPVNACANAASNHPSLRIEENVVFNERKGSKVIICPANITHATFLVLFSGFLAGGFEKAFRMNSLGLWLICTF